MIMAVPAKSGAFVYAHNVSVLVDFYSMLLSANVVRQTPDLTILACEGLQLIVHELPEGIKVPPNSESPRESSIKLFFSVANLDVANQRLVELGGKTMQEVWSNPVFSVCNAVDPEGNIFQLREFK